MPTIVDQIRSQVVEAIRAEARAQQPQAGALNECLRRLGVLRTVDDLWTRLREHHIEDGHDGLVPANLGARLSHAIFLDVLRTPAGLQLNNEVLGGCFYTLALGSVGCAGVDWLEDIDVALGSLDPITRAEHPMLSPHPAASVLRAKLLGEHHAHHEDEPLTALKRVVALGASWDSGQGLVGERLNAASVNGGGAAINVNGLSMAFDFVDRLRVHWLSTQGAVDRLQAISTQIRERLLQAAGQVAARQALQRISVLQAVELIATRLTQPGAAAPWGPADDAAVADPLGGAREQFRLPTLFKLVTGSDLGLLTPEFRFRLHWSLCHPNFGLEEARAPGHRLANYPRATVQHHDERGVIARLRFMMRIALNTASGVGIPGLPQRFAEQQAHQGPGDHAALAVLCRNPGLDPNVRQLLMQLPAGQRVNLAKRLVSIEVDTFRADPADNPGETSWIKQILETLPQETRSLALTADLAAEGRIRSDAASARAAYFTRKLNRREPPRWETIVLMGPGEFQSWLETSYHREFDGVGLVDLYNRVEQLIEDQEPEHRHKFEQALEAISRFAALAAGAPPHQQGFFGPAAAGGAQAFRTAVLNQVAPMGGVLSLRPWHALVLESLNNPQAGEALSGLAIQPAAGHADHEPLERVFRNPINEYDGLGRSRAVMVAMAARADVTRAALQTGGRLLGDPHKPSYGGVTPLMMAARHASDGNGAALESLSLYIASLDERSRELHDGRKWRAVHHALKAGNTRAAQLLVRSGCSLGVLHGDGVSSLIAAFGAPTDKFEETVRWVVEQLQRVGQPGALTADQVGEIVSFQFPERDSRGGRTNLLAASMRRPHFQEALPWLGSLAAQHPAAWNAPMVANPDNVPANMVDPALEDEVCRVMLAPAEFVVGLLDTAPHFAALVQNPACAQRVCRSLLAELTAQNIDSVAAKFAALIALGNVADADHVDPLVGNMFHQLVGRLRMIQAEGGQLPAPRAVFRLVQVLLSAPDSATALLQSFPAQDGTDPISKATRAGLHLVKFLYSQKLQGAKDDLHLAARFLADPGRYQADVDANQQLIRDGNGMVTLHCGVGQIFDLGMLPGAPSILVEAPFEPGQCEAFLRKAQIRIQRNLNAELIPAGEDHIGGRDILAIDLSAFVKWAAHQVRTQG